MKWLAGVLAVLLLGSIGEIVFHRGLEKRLDDVEYAVGYRDGLNRGGYYAMMMTANMAVEDSVGLWSYVDSLSAEIDSANARVDSL